MKPWKRSILRNRLSVALVLVTSAGVELLGFSAERDKLKVAFKSIGHLATQPEKGGYHVYQLFGLALFAHC